MPADIIVDHARSFLSLPFWEGVIPGLKAFGVVVSLFSIAGIIIVAMKSAERVHMGNSVPMQKKGQKYSEVGLPTVGSRTSERTSMGIAREQWTALVQKLEQQAEPRDYKLAIIEADALVDYVLQERGYTGETMADRMRAIQPGDMATVGVEELWAAHKVRNDIAHSPQRVVSSREGQEILRYYKHVLEELHAL